MTAPSNAFLSTVFRLALSAVTALALAAAAIVYAVGTNANQILTQATEAAIEADAAQLRSEHAHGGFEALASAVSERSRHAIGSVYYLADAAGQKRAGNLTQRPHEIRGTARAGL